MDTQPDTVEELVMFKDDLPITATPTSPEPHFPSPYRRPTSPLVLARRVPMTDGAQIAAFVYAPPLHGERLFSANAPAPVLMLHGNGEEHGIFGPMIDAAVTAGRTVVAVDSRAQGKSTRGTAELTYELMAQDAVAVLDALAVTGKVHLLGFSDGAIEALIIARDRPERVASLLSIGANLTPEGVIDDGWDLEGNVAANRVWAEFWGNGGRGASDLSAVDAIDASLLYCGPAQAAEQADLLQLMLDHPHIDPQSLRAIGCPTCVMAGEHDCIVEDETHAIAVAIPGARTVIVPGMGHSLPKKAPADVTRELLINILVAGC